MLQIRKDYLLERYVVIATDRGKRPKDFSPKNREISQKDKCPFCPGNEHMIPGVIDEARNDKGWNVRAIWNKYGASKPEGDPKIITHNEFYTFGDSVGSHEVIIDTPTHGEEMEETDDEHISRIIRMIIKRINENYKKKETKYVAVFKNRGEEAAASLSHSHHQIISYNIFPTEIKNEAEEVKSYKKKNGRCPYCKIIESEKDSERRIYQDNNVACFSPYASRFPLEAWILPKRCTHSIAEMKDEEIKSISKAIKKILMTLNKLGYPAYNIFYKISSNEEKDFHFRIEIAPRLAKWAGFEYTTGTIINTISPEDAGKFYREE